MIQHDPIALNAMGEALGLVVPNYAIARDPDDGRIVDAFAELAPRDRRDAARDMSVALDSCGFVVHRKVAGAGNGLGPRLSR
jgi:hypothetical protein